MNTFALQLCFPTKKKPPLHVSGRNDKIKVSKECTNYSDAIDDQIAYRPLEKLTKFGIYIRSYSLYLAGEKRKEEDIFKIREPLEQLSLQNENLNQLALELFKYKNKNNCLDAFGLYIYGVVLKEIQKESSRKLTHYSSLFIKDVELPSAHVILVESILQYPYNWSAWLDLSELCIHDRDVHSTVEQMLKPISYHWMFHFFSVHILIENQENESALIVIGKLMRGSEKITGSFFENSPYLHSQLAIVYYNMRNFDVAEDIFSRLLHNDPYRLDQIDIYSNILYVKEDRVALSQLAHHAVSVDKYRPETCCIIGNYYSLRSQHEKAVLYFQRALKLDRSYLSAWTLMGHEYIEMKNTAAAVGAYRRAVDINPRDFRAWYGLGQTYEIMNLLLYALFYYRKAVELRPCDARMWCAMGGCYYGLNRRTDAMRSYERAVANNDTEGIATRKLAMLYREDADVERAVRCYLRYLELRYRLQIRFSLNACEVPIDKVINSVQIDKPGAEALLYLAYYYRDNDLLELATLCCSRLQEYPGREKEEGKALLREIRSRMDFKVMKSKN